MRNGRKVFGGMAMLLAAMLAVLAVPGTAFAAEPGDVIASYKGKTLNLTEDGWGDAESCVVHSKSDVRCYETIAEANAAVRGTAPSGVEAAAWSCDLTWVCLYEHANGGGRRLQFNDDWWHDLYLYGFDRHVSSWRNMQGFGEWAELRDTSDKDGGCICTIRIDPGGTSQNLSGNQNDVMNHIYG